MANSERYNAHYRDLDLIQFTLAEIVDRYQRGLPLDWRDREDAERIIRVRAERAARQAAE